MNWTAEQVDALAPDSASVSAGRKLTKLANWVSLGSTGEALWGECKGSGKNPYQVRIDFNGPAYRCSCPSRKIPCKHALGLLYLYVAQGKSFAQDNPPEWLTAWLDDRQVRETKKVERAAKVVEAETPEARAKRLGKRLEKSREGLEELSVRLCDLVREGLGAAPGKSYQFWDQTARRLMDAQAPGAAHRVRKLAEIPASGDGWPERMLPAMGDLCLLVSATRQYENLPEGTQADVGAALGWTEKKETVLASEGVRDTWQVMAMTVEEDTEARLRVRRVWLWGVTQQRGALLLDFAAGAQPFEGSWFPGTAFEGELAFYPATYPMRAMVKGEPSPKSNEIPVGFPTLEAMLQSWVAAQSQNAWLGPFPVVVDTVVPMCREGAWALLDVDGRTVPLQGEDSVLWTLLAESGGTPMTVFGLWQDGALTVLPGDRIGGPVAGPPMGRVSNRIRQLARGMMLQNDDGGHPIPEADGALGDALAGLNGDTPAWRVLQAAALLALHDSAGWIPPAWSGAAPVVAEADERPEISPGAVEILAHLANGRYGVLWPEFLSLAARHGQQVPARYLPVVLDHAQHAKAVRDDVREILGPRGMWLAGFNESWAKLLEGAHAVSMEERPLSHELWETGSPEERVAWLSALRSADPGAARERMAAGFKKESAAARLSFVEVLSEGLSMDDEDFLEAALDDKSSRVNAAAVALLRQLPASRLVQRAKALLDGLVVSKKKLKLFAGLEVTAPDELTPTMQRDGITDAQPPGPKMGKKAAMLAQLIGIAPLPYWQERFGEEPAVLLKRAKSTDFEAALVVGWQEAAMREHSVSWLKALLDHPLKGEHPNRRDQMLESLPGEALESYVLAEVAPGVKLTYGNIGNAARIAEKLPRPWRREVGQAVLAWMRRHANHNDNQAASYGRQSMEKMTIMLPPSVLQEAQTGWPDAGPAWDTFTKKEDSFYDLLKMRYQLNQEFGE